MRTEKWQLRLIQLLTIPGLLLSFYLWLFHNGSLVAICAANGWDDCGKVSGPEGLYSAIGPIPVAAIGFAGYLVIFLIIWLHDFWPPLEDYLPEIMVGLSGLALLFTLYLSGLELLVIHAICRYCVVSAAIVLLIFILAFHHLRQVNRE